MPNLEFVIFGNCLQIKWSNKSLVSIYYSGI